MISLNPDYYLKWDEKRVVLFSKYSCNHGGRPEWVSIIHPLHAILLGMFGIDHNIDIVLAKLQDHISISSLAIMNFVNGLVDNNEPLNIGKNQENVNFPPKILIRGRFTHSQKNILDIINKCYDIKDVDLTSKRLYRTPLSFTWMLNNKCEVDCIYCYADTKHKSEIIPFEFFQKVIAECVAENIQKIEIIGGDFFLVKEWNLYIKCLVESNLSPSFLSTKKPLSTQDLQLLASSGYTNVLQISIDSLFADVLKKTINCKVKYLSKIREMFSCLRNLSLPFKLRISTVLTSFNSFEENIKKMHDFFLELDIIEEWEIRFAMPAYSRNDYFFCSESQISKMTDCIHSLIEAKDLNIIFIEYEQTNSSHRCILSRDQEYDYRCTANVYHFFVLPDGRVTLCERLYWNPHFVIGNIKDMSINQIWTSHQAIGFVSNAIDQIDKLSPCFSCEGQESCYRKAKRCWVNVLQKFGHAQWTFPDPLCLKSSSEEKYL